jgi:hypothetical protein
MPPDRLHPKSLAVRLRFEANRFAPEYLAAAYERLTPIPRRRIPATMPPHPLGDGVTARCGKEAA